MIDFIINNFNVLAECGLFSKAEFDLLSKVYIAFLVSVPALVVLLCTVDMAKAVLAQDDNAIKKAQSNTIKRLIAGVIVFFVPVLLNLLLGMNYTDTNGNKIDLGKKCATDIANS